jgi:hypothetical protein
MILPIPVVMKRLTGRYLACNKLGSKFKFQVSNFYICGLKKLLRYEKSIDYLFGDYRFCCL